MTSSLKNSQVLKQYAKVYDLLVEMDKSNPFKESSVNIKQKLIIKVIKL